MTPKHVVHVGFYESARHAVDFTGHRVTALMRRASAERLDPELAGRFAGIGMLDLADSADLDDYDRAFDQMRDLVEGFAGRFGPPDAVVGLYEHTTLPAARLRDHFGVPGTSLRTAALCRDKVRMKHALAAAGVRVPRFGAVSPATTAAELAAITGAFTGRVVLKPRSQAASFGVRIFPDAAQLAEFAAAEGFEEGYEVEEFVEGTICHFDGIVREGRLRFLSASRYLDSCFAFQYQDVPLASVTFDDPALVERAREYTETVLAVLGLTDSAFHLEVFHTPGDELVFLEVGNRFGGAAVPGHLKAVYDVDVVAESLRACTGEPSALPEGSTMLGLGGPGASGWLYVPMPGRTPCRVEEVRGLDALPASVVTSEVPRPGQVMDGNQDIWAASGKFVLRGASAAEVEQDMSKITGCYGIRTKELGE